jgi:predicted transcriptional regulator
MASELGFHVRTVYRSLKELDQAGLIERLPQMWNAVKN